MVGGNESYDGSRKCGNAWWDSTGRIPVNSRAPASSQPPPGWERQEASCSRNWVPNGVPSSSAGRRARKSSCCVRPITDIDWWNIDAGTHENELSRTDARRKSIPRPRGICRFPQRRLAVRASGRLTDIDWWNVNESFGRAGSEHLAGNRRDAGAS